MVIHRSITLEATMDEAWALLLDYKKWEFWWSKVKKARWVYPFKFYPGYVKYEYGSPSKVVGYVYGPQKSFITLASKSTMTTFKIKEGFSGLEFEIAQDTIDGAYYTDQGEGVRKQIIESLQKFKELLEGKAKEEV